MSMVDDERRGEDRRSPVGEFLLGALALRPDARLAYAELLQIAGDSGLNMSTVLAWAARAEEAGLVEQLTGPDGHGRALRLTGDGIELAANDRRRFHRRERWPAPPDDFR
jgi:DNA-binding MarR family transcriptional regulator